MREPAHIVINEQDWLRLEKLLAQVPGSPNNEWLQGELDRAEVLPPTSIPPGIVTMNSRIRYRDESTGKESEITIVYPKDADTKNGKISVLAPVGAALLGLAAGQSIEWIMPGGETRTLTVCAVLYQPENDGTCGN